MWKPDLADDSLVKQEARAVLAEFMGTYALTFTSACAVMVATISNHELDYIARVAAPGLMVMAMIYTFGHISGAHINAAVTVGFALRGAFAWLRVPGYLIAQCLGSLVAAFTLYQLFGNVEHLGATIPHHGILQSVVLEAVLTTFLVTVVVGTATDGKIVGHNAGIAVGGTVALCGMIGAPISGASMNPALSFGPSLLSGNFGTYWVYVLGPLTGTLLAVGLNFLTQGEASAQEQEAASGSGARPEHERRGPRRRAG